MRSASLTSPVGVVLNVVCGVSRISMEDIIKGVWSFMIAQLIVLFLMVPVSSARHRAGEMVQRLTCCRNRLHCIGITP